MLNTFLANIKEAIWNNQTVSIGGGTFTAEELKKILADITFLQNYHDPL
jgi:hypothetical protein